MTGGFIIQESDGQQVFETSEDFFFDGAPDPAFALSPSGAMDTVTATASKFLPLLADVSNSGKLSADLPDGFEIRHQSHVFLWCFTFAFLLGVGPVELTVE